MPAILLDPWLLTHLPNLDTADSYVERLTKISECAQGPLRFEISAEAASLLEQDEMFPLTRVLPGGLWPQRSDVFRLVNFLVDKLPKIEDSGVSDILFDTIDCHLPMEPGITNAHEAHIDKLAAIATLFGNIELVSDRAILTCRVRNARSIDCLVRPEIVDTNLNLHVADAYQATLVCGEDPDGLLRAIGADAFTNKDEFSVALCLAYTSRLNIANLPLEPRGWNVGDRFMESAEECNLFCQPARLRALVRTCVDVICRVNMAQTHGLREGQGGESPQVTRDLDGARAWRVDIDHELHMHYWQTPTGPEFANVVMHKGMHIY